MSFLVLALSMAMLSAVFSGALGPLGLIIHVIDTLFVALLKPWITSREMGAITIIWAVLLFATQIQNYLMIFTALEGILPFLAMMRLIFLPMFLAFIMVEDIILVWSSIFFFSLVLRWTSLGKRISLMVRIFPTARVKEGSSR